MIAGLGVYDCGPLQLCFRWAYFNLIWAILFWKSCQ